MRKKNRCLIGCVCVMFVMLLGVSGTTVSTISTEPKVGTAKNLMPLQGALENRTVTPKSHQRANGIGSEDHTTEILDSHFQNWPPVRPVLGPNGVEVAAGELIVIPSPGQSDQLKNKLKQQPFISSLTPLPILGAYRIRLIDDMSLSSGMESIRNFKECAKVTSNAIIRGTSSSALRGAGRKRTRSSFALRDTGRKRSRTRATSAFWNLNKAGIPQGRGLQNPKARSDYIIALLDSGVSTASPSLSGVDLVDPFDALDEGTFPDDENGHGTFLANLLVGNPGIAAGAALMPVRVLDEELVGTEASLVTGIHHATLYGADVINLSLVFSEHYRPTQLFDAAFADALSNHTIIVASAGNRGQPVVSYPASLPGVIAVGASTLYHHHQLTRTSYSCWGAALDLLAPGGDLSQDANRDGIPDGIIAESFHPEDPTEFGPWLYAGTSQAAAHVSAASVWLLAAGVPRERVLSALRAGAMDDAAMGASGFDIETGSGHLHIWRSTRHAPPPVTTGVQTVPVLHQDSDGIALGAVVSVVDDEGNPIEEADVYAKFWCTVQPIAHCTTDISGVCTVDAGLLASECDIAIVSIEALVLPDGTVSRPSMVASQAEIDEVMDSLDGTGFGSSSILWFVDPSFAQLFFWQSMNTWLLFGSGEGSALAPTVVAFGEQASGEFLDNGLWVEGNGFGSSSLSFYSINWFSYYFIGTWYFSSSIYGGGFGSSSLSYYIYWGGWTFLWQPLYSNLLFGAKVTGSPLYDIAGAYADRMQGVGISSE